MAGHFSQTPNTQTCHWMAKPWVYAHTGHNALSVNGTTRASRSDILPLRGYPQQKNGHESKLKKPTQVKSKPPTPKTPEDVELISLALQKNLESTGMGLGSGF